MSNVIAHQTAVWSQLKTCYDLDKAQARAYWPTIAHDMARLRRDYPSDEAFGFALFEHGIEYNKDDRAAFIWMGGLSPEAMEDALALCGRKSPRHFRREIEKVFSDEPHFKPVSPRGETDTSSIKIPENVEKEPGTPEIVTSEPEKNDVAASIDLASSPMGDEELIISVIKEGNTRASYRKLMAVRGADAKEIVGRIAERVRAGLRPLGGTKPNARLAFPGIIGGVPTDYDLTTPKGCRKLLQDWDALAATEAYFLAHPEMIRNKDKDGILAHEQMQRFRKGITNDAEAKAHLEKVTNDMVASVAAGKVQDEPCEAAHEGLVQAYGVVLWSPDQTNTWGLTFSYAWGIFGFWKDFESWLKLSIPDSGNRGVAIMQNAKFLRMCPSGRVIGDVLFAIGANMKRGDALADQTCCPPKLHRGA